MKMRQRKWRGNRKVYAHDVTPQKTSDGLEFTRYRGYWLRYYDKTRITSLDVAYSRTLACTKRAAKKFNWKRKWA